MHIWNWQDAFFFSASTGRYGSWLLHVKNIQSFGSNEQGPLGKYQPDGQGQSEDPRDFVQHTQTSSGMCVFPKCQV